MPDSQCKPVYEETFYIIPRRIRKLSGITLAFLDIYETIFQFWNKQLPCYLSNKTIEERTGVGHSQARAALAFFETNGELERKVINGRRYLVQPVKQIETDCNDSEDAAPPAPPCRSSGTPPAAPPAHNIKKDTNKEKQTTTTCSSSFNPFENKCLEFKHPSDERTPDEFLENVHHHVKLNSDPESGEYQRQQMILKLLRNLYENAAHFKSKGFVSKETVKETSKKHDEHNERLLWSRYQGYINSPIEQDLREKGIANLESFEEWKLQNA